MRADPEDLELIWLNLLENAVQYSPSGSQVKMRVNPNGGAMAEVSVSGFRPGHSSSELPHIFERFHRGDPSRARSTGGFGLGLAICKAWWTPTAARSKRSIFPAAEPRCACIAGLR